MCLFALRLPIPVAHRALKFEYPGLRAALIDLQVEPAAVGVPALMLKSLDLLHRQSEIALPPPPNSSSPRQNPWIGCRRLAVYIGV